MGMFPNTAKLLLKDISLTRPTRCITHFLSYYSTIGFATVYFVRHFIPILDAASLKLVKIYPSAYGATTIIEALLATSLHDCTSYIAWWVC
jgi:hypothetical protein